MSNHFWKPDEEVKKAIKKGSRDAKRKKRKTSRLQDNLRRHFKLHKYATNVAICFCIHKETGKQIPGKYHETVQFMAEYWRSATRGKARKSVGRMPSKEFYASKKWKELRYIALEQSDGKCCLCGTPAGYGVILHVDHIKPRSRFPEHQYDLDNLQVVCSECNIGKSNYDDRDWRLLM